MMLRLPIHDAVRFVLVRPHYPENVGAAARAMKTMGFSRLTLVKPGRLAMPEHEMALKMAVKSRDVLEASTRAGTLEEALEGIDWTIATTSRRGVSGVRSPRELSPLACREAELGRSIAFVFGNEKSGLTSEDLERCQARLRVPMAADQPSVNLAQAVQIVAYELLVTALACR
jgi:tRNA/rRNA methyltransferase